MTRGPDRRRQAAAWGVHLMTASGAVFSLLALEAGTRGAWRAAFSWLAVAVFVDGIDGGLARWIRVKEVLPGFDGALLDNLVDYASYVLVPAYLLHRAGLLPHDVSLAAAAAVCVASAYQFAQESAKTADHYFTGFPSYWNIAVLYLMVLDLGTTANLIIVAALIVLVFVPLKYVYPSRTPRFRTVTVALTSLWGAATIAILWQFPEPSPWLLWLSGIYVVYYVGVSVYLQVVRD